MSRWSKPWLQRFHRNFFIIYVIMAVHSIWAGINGIFGPSEWYDFASLEYVNYLSPQWWGVLYLLVGVGLIAGLFRDNFKLARSALAAGLFLESTRWLLILLTVVNSNAGANALTNLLVVVGVYLSMLLEPPVNPSSVR